jgi:3-oxoadipate CoA-transferase alpha subunit
LIRALAEQGARDLTIIANSAAGMGDTPEVGMLVARGQVRKAILSYPVARQPNSAFERAYVAGEIELELVPQGTLAERIRAGGAGIPAFYTPTGYGTPLAAGKETREFDGRHYVLERAIRADVALIHARTGDRWGNLTYPKTARNFNPIMAMAASTTLAEVRRFVDVVAPEEVVTPGIFVSRMVETGER